MVHQCYLMTDGFYVLFSDQKDKNAYTVKYHCMINQTYLNNKKMLKVKKMKEFTDKIVLTMTHEKKEKSIKLLFGFGSDYDGWKTELSKIYPLK